MSLTGDFIKQRRVALNITQKFIGAKLGFTDVFIAKIEAGTCQLPVKYVSKLAQLLQTEKDALMICLQEDMSRKMKLKAE